MAPYIKTSAYTLNFIDIGTLPKVALKNGKTWWRKQIRLLDTGTLNSLGHGDSCTRRYLRDAGKATEAGGTPKQCCRNTLKSVANPKPSRLDPTPSPQKQKKAANTAAPDRSACAGGPSTHCRRPFLQGVFLCTLRFVPLGFGVPKLWNMALNKGIWDPNLRGTNIKGTTLKSWISQASGITP